MKAPVADTSLPAMSASQIEWVTDPARFAAVAEAWDELAGLEDTPFLRHAWLAAWWDAFGAARGELRVCLVWRGEQLAGGLALLQRGRVLEALADYHSPRFGAVARDTEACAEVAAAVAQTGAPQVVLPALDRDDPLLTERHGRTPLVEPYMVSPIADTTGDWDEYRSLTKSRWGAPLERFRRKMVRENAAHFELVAAPDAGDLDAILDRGFAVEASGWKGREGTAILSTPETAQFYRAVAHAFQASGELRLSWLDLDGEMVAFDLCLLYRGRLYLLKTGFDEARRRLAPGLVLRLSVLERCFEMGLEAHELLGGADDWKLKFATSERRHVTLRSFGRRPTARGLYAYRRWARPALRSVYRRAAAARG
jgi:CelD/BcsL family acetyltransferase involved in cellulose biosynthesis